MRRTAKPFTVEVKRAGRVRKNGLDDTGSLGVVGSDIRFRDAEKMFRNPPPDEDEVPVYTPAKEVTVLKHVEAPALERRILPDLIAEAALSEQTDQLDLEQPRRRGRPPKDRTGDTLVAPVRRGRPARPEMLAAEPDVTDTLDDEEIEMTVSFSPVLVDLAASARRRAARDTTNLPRAERWKRRLPKVCW